MWKKSLSLSPSLSLSLSLSHISIGTNFYIEHQFKTLVMDVVDSWISRVDSGVSLT